LARSLITAVNNTAAFRPYEALRTLLAAELDIAPMPETTALIERVRRARTPPRDHFPAPATPLFGRAKELAHLRRLLATNKGAARLITISGPGDGWRWPQRMSSAMPSSTASGGSRWRPYPHLVRQYAGEKLQADRQALSSVLLNMKQPSGCWLPPCRSSAIRTMASPLRRPSTTWRCFMPCGQR